MATNLIFLFASLTGENIVIFRSSQQLPSRTLDGILEPRRRPSRALDLVVPVRQRYKRQYQVWRASRKGPITQSKTADANLDCASANNARFLQQSLSVNSQRNKIVLVTIPAAQ